MKYKDGKSKWLLREMLYRYVPKKLIERPKMGFLIPISDWINSDLKQWSNDLLSKSTINNQAIFEYGPISELLLEHSSGKVPASHRRLLLPTRLETLLLPEPPPQDRSRSPQRSHQHRRCCRSHPPCSPQALPAEGPTPAHSHLHRPASPPHRSSSLPASHRRLLLPTRPRDASAA